MQYPKRTRRASRYSKGSRRFPRYSTKNRSRVWKARPRNSLKKSVAAEVRRHLRSPKLRPETKVYYSCHFANRPYLKQHPDSRKQMMMSAVRLPFWPIQSKPASMKQFLLPLTSLVPGQRPSQSAPDQRFRQDERVWIDWVRIQMDIVHRSSVRGQLFVFPNAERRNASASQYPYAFVFPNSKVADSTVPTMPTELNMYGISKSNLLGEGEEPRQIGITDGPFSYTKDNFGNQVWKTSDGEAYNAVMSRSEGRAVGDITVRVDCGPQKKKGPVCKFEFPVTSHQGQNLRYHHVDFFIKIGMWQKFKNPGNSLVEGEKPLEVFLFLDTPCVAEGDDAMDTGTTSVVDKVTGLTIEACFRY
jgi:hypothetical protein